MNAPTQAVMLRRRRLPSRGFMVRVAVLPVLVVVLLAMLFEMGSSALQTQQAAMTQVVETDLESSVHLAEINSRMQSANAEMYRLISLAAAGGGGDFRPRIQDLAARVEGIALDLDAYRKSEAALAQGPTLERFIEDLQTYKGAIDWLGSMLEIDFKAAAAFIEPYNAHVETLSRQLSAIIAESTATAKARAEVASGALKRVAIFYVIAAASVCILVALFAYLMGTRQERLYIAAKRKTEQVEVLLDNSGQGFLAFGADLVVGDEFSQACIEMFAGRPAGRLADELLFPGPDGEGARDLMRAVVERVMAENDMTRRAIILSLLPQEVELNDKVLAIEYRALGDGSIMLVVTDVTEARHLAREVERERQRLEMIVAAVSDGQEFFDAVEDFRRFSGWELDALLGSDAEATAKFDEVYRQVHTFKGTFSQFSFHHLPLALHRVEETLMALGERDGGPDPELIRDAMAAARFPDRLEDDLRVIRDVLGDVFVEGRGTVSLSVVEAKRLEQLATHLAGLAVPEARELIDRLAALRKVSLKSALADFDRLVQRVAERCDKEVAPLSVQGDDVLLPPDRLQPFLRALGHVFRNAVDHGIETPEERLAAGKDEVGRVFCTISNLGQAIRIEIADDGAGIDRDALRQRLAALGEDDAAMLSGEALIQQVFADGVSTRPDVSEISGRGIGLAAVRGTVESLGGEVRLASEPGRGTRFIFVIPNRDNSAEEAA